MNIKEALRRLVDVTRLIDANECGELYNELQSALYVAGEALHEADTNKPKNTLNIPMPKPAYGSPESTSSCFNSYTEEQVNAHVAKAVAAEREACAKEAEDFAETGKFYDVAKELAAAIRARA